jgi:prepilin-type N-terminal cleavage/methylation domain-containing protein
MVSQLPDSRLRASDGFTILEILMVVALIAVITVIAVPMSGNAIAGFRVSGDSRGVSNSLAVAKMRAASKFTRVRLYVDLADRSHHIELWDKDAGDWTTEGGITYLSTGVDFGFGVAGTPPPNTQGTIGQASACKDKDGNDIGNTACVVFNSRGIPVGDTTPSTAYPPTADDAIYLTNGTSLFAVTVAATGMVRNWTASPTASPTWTVS